MKIIRVFSSFVAVLIGLIPALLLFFGTEWLFERDVYATAETSTMAFPTDPFVVNFNTPVHPESFVGHISIIPATPVLIGWDDNNTKLSIKPVEKWKESGKYQVLLSEGTAGFGRSLGPVSFAFDVPGYPEIVSMAPETGSKDVLLGIEDPITVRFDRSTRNFFVDFRFSPALPVVYENDVEKTEFKLLPKEPLAAGTIYSLAVYAKWDGEEDDAYVRIGETTFTTLPEKPKERSRDPASRLENAKRFTQPARVEGKYIDIDIASQVMILFENGKPLDAYLVSSGLRGMDTPKGMYQIHNKARRPWSRKYELYMPYWMAITSDGKYGIHELPEWPNGYKEGANHLGIPVSHGCVRLGIGPAERAWNWAEIGTLVVIH